MSDAERMARAFRTALHNCNGLYEDFNDISRMTSIYRNYVGACQALLDAGYQIPPPPRETTVNDNKIGEWVKLTANGDDSGGTMMYAVRGFWHDTNLEAVTEADALNAIVAYVVEHAVFGRQLGVNMPPPEYQTVLQARRLLEPLGITTETMRPKAKTVRERASLLLNSGDLTPKVTTWEKLVRELLSDLATGKIDAMMVEGK